MKAFHRLLRHHFITISLPSAMLAGMSNGAIITQYWNVGGTGGDGVWGTSPGEKNWNLVSGAGSGNIVWPDTVNDLAVFQDAVGGTVTVFDPVQTHGILQDGANYTINAGSITLVQDAVLTTPFISVQTGTLTIDSVLEGADGLIKNGNGILVLSSSNTYSGQTTVSAGTLSLTGSLLSGTVDVSAGATFSDQTGGLAPASSVTNAGTFSVNAAETISIYTQNGTGILAGTNTLTVTSATLNGGTVSGDLSGNTTSTGTVLVSGSIGGGSLSVTGGTLTLSGLSTNSTVGISSGASLIDSNGGLSSSAIVTNAGTLTVNAAETVSTYTQNGSGILSGTDTLTATDATLNGGTVSGNLSGNTTSTGNVLVSGSIGGGSLSVTGGTLTLSGTSTNGTVGISSGAVLIDSNGGLSSSAIVTNAGTLTVNAAETITSYTQNGSGVLDGSATLTATSGATLNGGTVSGSLSGNTTSTGTVLVSGSIGGGSLSVTSGTLTLTGTSTSTPVEISASATLVDSNGGLDVSADVTNAGTLTVNAADSIKTYTQNASGLLNGGATLTAVNGATLNGGTVSGNLLGDTTSTGTVLVSGTIGGGLLSVSSGTLTLTGTSTNTPVSIASAATLVDSNGGLDSSSLLTNAGILTVSTADTIKTYTQNGSGTLNGAGTLSVSNGATLNGGTVSGNLLGDTTSTGTVLVSGSIGGGSLSVTGGTLTLTGTSSNSTIGISSGAALTDSNGGLSPSADLTNAGTFSVNAADAIATYAQNGSGILAGTNFLTVTSATLNGGTVSGNLLGNTTSTGAVLVSGSIGGGSLSVTSGTLTLTGLSTNSGVGVSSGASLIDSIGGLSSSAIFTNAGTLTVNAADTITSYTQNGNGVLDGSSTLTTTSGATLNGGTVSGSLLGNISSTGTVLVSGSIGGGSLSVTGGTLTLNGTSTNSPVSISSGAILVDSNGGLLSSAIVTNSGTLTVNAADTINTYTQNGGGLLSGTDILTATSATLNGGTVSGILLAGITSTGTVLVSGTIGGGSLSVTGGTLTLSGTSNHLSVGISTGASLIDTNGGLHSGATLTNAGSLSLTVSDLITRYVSNAGSLAAAPGALTTLDADLRNGSSIAGHLVSGDLISNGSVSVSGSVSADLISIRSGILTNTGTLGTTATHLDLATGAMLVANGTQSYGLLTTSGLGSGTWQGTLTNSTMVAPGGEGRIGSLLVTGDFSTSPAGVLKLDIGSFLHDHVTVGGLATFGGTLELKKLGTSNPAPFVPIQVVTANSYSGGISALVEDLDGAVFFNPGSGEITLLAAPGTGGGALFGTTGNQASTWISLYDDVIDPGVRNISYVYGASSGYDISSGIANPGNPDLLWALSSSFVPGGLDTQLLNRLSPEVYLGFQDYSVQTTRNHHRSALSAPALSNPSAVSNAGDGANSNQQFPSPQTSPTWELIAAADFFHGESNTSLNFADSAMEGFGILSGARARYGDQYVVAGYLAVDSGSVEGGLAEASVTGVGVGVTGGVLLDQKSRTFLTSGMSFGSYSFDGHRESASATSAGWSPGRVHFSGVDVSAFDFFVGLESIAYQQDRFRIISSARLRYDWSSSDRFEEVTGAAAGSPLALAINDASHQSLMIELALLAQAELTDRLTVWSQIGFNAGVGEDPMAITARFAKGARSMRAETDGLGNDLFFISLGAGYSLNKAVSLGLAFRSEVRDGGAPMQSVNLSSTFSF